jgi:hypothetical protein
MAKNGTKRGRVWYCGYCHAAKFSIPDSRWIPHLCRGEKLPAGVRKIKGIILKEGCLCIDGESLEDGDDHK